MEKRNFIFYKLRESSGSDHCTKLTAVTNVATGKTELIISHEVSQRLPVQELRKAEDLFERLTCGSGRRVYIPEDLAHHYNPN